MTACSTQSRFVPAPWRLDDLALNILKVDREAALEGAIRQTPLAAQQFNHLRQNLVEGHFARFSCSDIGRYLCDRVPHD
jgi:hypothetical protein